MNSVGPTEGPYRVQGKWLGALWLTLAASIWGSMYVISKIVLNTVPAIELVWLRYVIGLLCLVLLGIITRQSWRIRWRDIPLILVIGVVGYGLSIWAQFRGTQLTTAQMGSIVTAATPAFMVVFGRLLLGERVNWRRAASVGLATLGVVLVVGVQGLSGGSGGLILLVAAVSWALMSVLVKRVPSDYSALVITTYAILTATLLITPDVLLHDSFHRMATLSPTLWLGILYLGVVSTAAAFLLWTRGLQLVQAGHGGLYFFFQPLVGTTLGWFVLKESIHWPFWSGAFLIFVGVLIVVREPSHPAPSHAQTPLG